MPEKYSAPDSEKHVSGISGPELRQEAEHLHRRLFGCGASPQLVANYLRAHDALPELHDAPASQLNTMRTILTRRLDAVSVEPWLRNGYTRHILSRKLLLVSYLAECDAKHPEYASSSEGPVQGWLKLLLAGLKAGLGLARGWYLKARYGLV